MSILRKASLIYVGALFSVALAAGFIAPHDYATQFRDRTGEPPSAEFLLGTDDLGRDRFSRLLFASRLTLLIAPGTAAATILVIAAAGIVAGWRGGWLDSGITMCSDLFLSLPLLFLILTLRALLPLNVAPAASVAALALVFVAAAWPPGTRAVRGVTAGLRTCPAVVHARAYGSGGARLISAHVLPRLRPVLRTQFWILVPTFVIAEVNLGILGLGISEPLPSLGNLLAELRDYHRITEAPWILAPAVLLVSLLTALHFVISGADPCV